MALSKAAASSNGSLVQTLAPVQEIEEIAMGIDMGAITHLLDRLTDLYPLPIDATVREVLSNAADATALAPEADRQPIEVTLPTPFKPFFIVKDRGIGMSLETVKKIYTQYGASTKKQDFRQIGAYGLGAKAPLAYCSEFTVITVHNGELVEFVCSRTPKGNFTKIVRSEKTAEPNGTQVIIPVKHHDVTAFKTAVELFKRFTFTSSLIVDGEAAAQREYVELPLTFTLDEDTELTGRVWLRRAGIPSALLAHYGYQADHSSNYVFSLSGWPYKAITDYRISDPMFAFELKPGVVDFSSSRDDITTNDRARALDSRIKSFIKSEEMLEALWAIYSALSPEHARRVGAAFLAKAARSTDVTLTLKADTYYSQEGSEVAIERFTTAEHFNPIRYFIPADKKTIKAGIRLHSAGLPDFLVRSTLTAYGKDFFTSGQITKLNQHVQANLAEKAGFYSVTELAGRYALTRELDPGRQAPAFFVISDVDAESGKRILAARRTLESMENVTDRLVLFSTLSGSSLRAQLKLAREQYQVEIATMPAAELLSQIKGARKAEREHAKANPSSPTLYLKQLTEGLAKETELSTYRRAETVAKTIDQIKQENALLVLTGTASPESALIGAANAGVIVTNRPIYIADKHTLKAPHFRSLEGYAGLILSRGYQARSAIAAEVTKDREYFGRTLNARVKEVAPDIIAKLYLDSTAANEGFVQDFAVFLKKHYAHEKKLVKVVDLAARGYKNKESVYLDVNASHVKLALKSSAPELISLHSFLSKYRNYNLSMTETTHAQFIRNYNRLPSEDLAFAEYIYHHIVESYLAHRAQAA